MECLESETLELTTGGQQLNVQGMNVASEIAKHLFR